jgi:hypothetical protein
MVNVLGVVKIVGHLSCVSPALRIPLMIAQYIHDTNVTMLLLATSIITDGVVTYHLPE